MPLMLQRGKNPRPHKSLGDKKGSPAMLKPGGVEFVYGGEYRSRPIHEDKMIISIRSAVSVFLEDESFKGKYWNSSQLLRLFVNRFG